METSLHFIGANGSVIDLFSNDYFWLTGADGLTSVSSAVSSSTTPNMDGDMVNSIQTQPRPITLYLLIKDGVDVEEAKRYILRTVKPKQRGTLRMIQGDRDLEIVGLADAITMPRFGAGVRMQISLYCSLPYWTDAEYIALEISRVIDLHYFPIEDGGLALPADGIPFGVYDTNMTRTYTNEGDADCGMVITIIALAEVINPTIYKADGSFIGITDTMEAGDEVIINTNRGEKTIKKNGVDIISKIKPGSKFLQLDTGDNVLTIKTDDGTDGNVYFTLTFKRRFV